MIRDAIELEISEAMKERQNADSQTHKLCTFIVRSFTTQGLR